MIQRQQLQKFKLYESLQAIFIFAFSFFYFQQIKPFTNVLIYQGRDLQRAADIALSGKQIWFGPELFGGGFLPGSFYYYLMALPIWLSNSMYSNINFLHLLTSLACMYLFIKLKNQTNQLSFWWFYALFMTIPYTIEFILQFENPSFLYLFAAFIFCKLYVDIHKTSDYVFIGVALSLAAQIHGTATVLFYLILLFIVIESKLKTRAALYFVLSYFSTHVPYYIWRLTAGDINWGSLQNSMASISNDSLAVFASWLNQGSFLKNFFTNLISNLQDHFFWSPTSKILFLSIFISFLYLKYKKINIVFNAKIRLSLFISFGLLASGYFYLIAFPLERPRYVLLAVFSSLYFIIYFTYEICKYSNTLKIINIISILGLVLFILQNPTAIHFDLIFMTFIIIFALLFFKEIKNSRSILIPAMCMFLVSHQNLLSYGQQMMSAEMTTTSFNEDQFSIRCPKIIRTIHEHGINDIREFLTISSMQQMAQSIYTETGWSAEYLNSHISFFGINQSNEFFTVYKNYSSSQKNKKNSEFKNLFVFDSLHLCLQERDNYNRKKNIWVPEIAVSELNFNSDQFINSYKDIDPYIKSNLIKANKNVFVLGPLVLIFTAEFENYTAINNLGYPYRQSAMLYDQNQNNFPNLIEFEDCSAPEEFCKSSFRFELKNSKILYEIVGASLAQPTKDSLPAFVQEWSEPKLKITCANNTTYDYNLARKIGNFEFDNFLLAPLRGAVETNCSTEIKSLELQIAERRLRKFETITVEKNVKRTWLKN